MNPMSMVAGAIVGAGSLILAPEYERMKQFSNERNPVNMPSIQIIVRLFYRGKITPEEYYAAMAKIGFSEGSALAIWDSEHQLLSAGDYVTAWRRELIDEENLNIKLLSLGFDNEAITTIKSVTEYFPGVSDIVRFAVREVYSPEVVSQFGLDSDLPVAFVSEAAKAGLPEEQAKNFWRSHWNLPSLTQGFEMFHRQEITLDQLTMLMRTQDVMPFWRDKLLKIAYQPLTRVDVRRMYELGVIDREAVYNSYLDIGYSSENAELMTQFTIKYEAGGDLGLSKTTIIKSFKEDLLTEQEAGQGLAELGYTEAAIQLMLQLATYEKYEGEIKLFVSDLISRYRIGEISLDDARNVLNTLDLPAAYVNSVINKERLSTAAKTKMPTKADLDNWLIYKIIDEKEYSIYLGNLGYREIDIIRYLEMRNFKETTALREFLSVAVYQRWLTAGIMTEEAFRDTLTKMKVSSADIDKAVKEAREKALK